MFQLCGQLPIITNMYLHSFSVKAFQINQQSIIVNQLVKPATLLSELCIYEKHHETYVIFTRPLIVGYRFGRRPLSRTFRRRRIWMAKIASEMMPT